jgi:5'(3')-deoxyribonucleotidase
MDNMNKIEIFVDMDGVLVPFDTTKSIEEVAKPGYSLGLPKMENMCKALKELSKYYNVRILSSVLHDTAIRDKREWLRNNFNEDFAFDALFVPYGTSKNDIIKKISDKSRMFLIDDFSKNLHEWEGVGIKVYNGINGSNGSWKGYSVHSNADWKIIFNQLVGIIMSSTMLIAQ